MSWVPGIRSSSVQPSADKTNAVVGQSKSATEEMVMWFYSFSDLVIILGGDCFRVEVIAVSGIVFIIAPFSSQALPSAFRQRGLTEREQMDSDIIREFYYYVTLPSSNRHLANDC